MLVFLSLKNSERLRMPLSSDWGILKEVKLKYKTKDFYGTVLLKDWLHGLDGLQYKQITGKISIINDKELVGFSAKGNESNWVARIEGHLQTYTILGCQIRGVVTHDKDLAISSHEALIL